MLNTGRIHFVPLEAYNERYTLQTQQWFTKAFADIGVSGRVNWIGSPGEPRSIGTGVILDCFNRCDHALSQTKEIVRQMRDGQISSGDTIYFHDMYHPGFDAILYCASVANIDLRYVSHCFAQSFDIYDFTFKFRHWMRKYEDMASAARMDLFVGSDVHSELVQIASDRGWGGRIINAGLPFDADEVRERAGLTRPRVYSKRPSRVIFSSRVDDEKNVEFFLKVAKEVQSLPGFKDVEFAITTSQPHLRSNSSRNLELIAAAIKSKSVVVYEGLSKSEYYKLLSESRLHFLSSLQDWVSYTMLEAAAVGTPTVAPCFRSFPELLDQYPEHLYTPWSVQHAAERVEKFLEDYNPTKFDVADRYGQCAHITNVNRMRFIGGLDRVFGNQGRTHEDIDLNAHRDRSLKFYGLHENSTLLE